MLFFREGALEGEAFERESAGANHDFAFAQSGQNLGLTERFAAERHFVQLVLVLGFAHEDDRLAGDLGDAGLWHDETRLHGARRFQPDLARAEQADAQQVVTVLQTHARGHGAADRIDLLADVFDHAREMLIGVGVEVHLGGEARLERAQIFFEDASQKPNFIQIGDDPRAVGESIAVVTRVGCERVIRYAFEYALRQGRKKVTIVHKANILKMVSGLFLEVGKQIAKEYAGRIESNDMIVDNTAMQLVMRPEQFDVMVTTNMFGDILSDEVSGLVGGLGLAPGANIGTRAAIFEAVHGSAPDIAGKGVANPSAQMLAAAMMLDHVGELDAGRRIRQAVEKVIVADNLRTRDLGRCPRLVGLRAPGPPHPPPRASTSCSGFLILPGFRLSS